MTVQFSQLQFAVTESEYDKIQNKDITVEDIPARKVAGRLTKSFKNIPIPRIGESISDPYWPSDVMEQKVVDVCYDYSDNCCYVYLEPFFMIEGGQLHRELKKISNLHGWEYHSM